MAGALANAGLSVRARRERPSERASEQAEARAGTAFASDLFYSSSRGYKYDRGRSKAGLGKVSPDGRRWNGP